MTKAEFVQQVAAESGLTKKQAEKAVSASLQVMTDALVAGEKVSFLGFGTFETRKREERTSRNPRTGEPVLVPACKVPAFKAGKSLKDAVK